MQEKIACIRILHIMYMDDGNPYTNVYGLGVPIYHGYPEASRKPLKTIIPFWKSLSFGCTRCFLGSISTQSNVPFTLFSSPCAWLDMVLTTLRCFFTSRLFAKSVRLALATLPCPTILVSNPGEICKLSVNFPAQRHGFHISNKEMLS